MSPARNDKFAKQMFNSNLTSTHIFGVSFEPTTIILSAEGCSDGLSRFASEQEVQESKSPVFQCKMRVD